MPFHQSSASSPVAPGASRAALALERPVVAGERVDVPGEHVADRDLAGLVPVQPGQDPVAEDAGDPGQPDLAGVDDHVADRRADDHHERAGVLDAGAGNGDERVDVADRDGDRLGQAEARRRLRAQRAGARTERRERRAELLLRPVEAGVCRGEILA